MVQTELCNTCARLWVLDVMRGAFCQCSVHTAHTQNTRTHTHILIDANSTIKENVPSEPCIKDQHPPQAASGAASVMLRKEVLRESNLLRRIGQRRRLRLRLLLRRRRLRRGGVLSERGGAGRVGEVVEALAGESLAPCKSREPTHRPKENKLGPGGRGGPDGLQSRAAWRPCGDAGGGARRESTLFDFALPLETRLWATSPLREDHPFHWTSKCVCAPNERGSPLAISPASVSGKEKHFYVFVQCKTAELFFLLIKTRRE